VSSFLLPWCLPCHQGLPYGSAPPPLSRWG